MWTTWTTECSDANCGAVQWSEGGSENVVWGSACGGSDCPPGTVWASSDGDMVVWGSGDGDMVVWGSSDTDMVVWGSSCADPSCEPVIWPPQ